jgi:signal transduction histidine kinase
VTGIIVTIEANRRRARYRGLVELARNLVRHAIDAVVLVLAVLGQVEIWSAPISRETLALALTASMGALPLLARQRFPFGAPTLVFAALAGMALVTPSSLRHGSTLQLVAVLSLMLALWLAGAHNTGEHAVAAVAIGLASTAVVARSGGADLAVVGDDSELGILGVFLIGGGLALAAFVLKRRAHRADALAHRAAVLEREREERARAAVIAERARIARDLHDVIARSVTVMTVRAEVARLLLAEDPQRARDTALSVEETGRQALTEMRRLLGVLRTEDDEPARAPQPGMGDVRALLEEMARAGLRVELDLDGDPTALPPGVDLAAYRIVEEALASALRDAHASRAHVTMRWGLEALELEITNDGRAGSDRNGREDGLVVMRELVALYGGELAADVRAGTEYAVRARLPFSQPPSVRSCPTAGEER